MAAYLAQDFNELHATINDVLMDIDSVHVYRVDSGFLVSSAELTDEELQEELKHLVPEEEEETELNEAELVEAEEETPTKKSSAPTTGGIYTKRL